MAPNSVYARDGRVLCAHDYVWLHVVCHVIIILNIRCANGICIKENLITWYCKYHPCPWYAFFMVCMWDGFSHHESPNPARVACYECGILRQVVRIKSISHGKPIKNAFSHILTLQGTLIKLNTLCKVADHENHVRWIYLTTVLCMGDFISFRESCMSITVKRNYITWICVLDSILHLLWCLHERQRSQTFYVLVITARNTRYFFLTRSMYCRIH